MKAIHRLLVGLLVTGLIATACGPTPTASPAQSPTQPPAAATAAPAATTATAQDLVLCPGQTTATMVDTAKYKKDGPWTIGVSNVSVANIWRVQLMAEFEAAAEKHSGQVKELIITDAGGDVSKQISDVEDLLARGVDALIITPASPTALNPVLEKVYDQGIPVILFSTDASTEKVTARLLPNYSEFSRVAAQWLADTLQGKGNIVALRGIAGLSAEEDEWNSAMAVFGKYPDIKVLGFEYADWAYDKGKRASESLLAAHPQFDGVFSVGDQMSWAMVEAIVEAKRELVPITAIGGGNGFQKARLKYQFPAIDVVVPTWISEMALEVTLQVMQGQSVPACQSVPVQVITDADVAKFAKLDLPDGYNAGSHLPQKYIDEIFKQ